MGSRISKYLLLRQRQNSCDERKTCDKNNCLRHKDEKKIREMDKKELELAGGKLEKISGSKSTVLVLGGHVRRTCGAVNLINQS